LKVAEGGQRKRRKRAEQVGVNSDAGTGAGLKVGFNTEGAECAESPSRSLASRLPSRLPSGLASKLSVNRVKGTGGIGPSRLRVNAKHGEW
jgi:hypothetical protein